VAVDDRVPPAALFVCSAVSMYTGAALAVDVFDEVAPESVAWLRLVAAAAVLAALVRPWRHRWSGSQVRSAAGFGVALAAMNVAFYLATARVHLGSTVAIEFLGPISVAAWSARSRRAVAAVVLAGSGVLLLGLGLRTDAWGVVWALVAGACWAAYIVAGQRVSGQRSGSEGLALALVIGAVVATPVGWWGSGPALGSPHLLVVITVVGLLSSLVPYGLDQRILRRIGRGEFATYLAISPVTATVMGRVLLVQRPRWFELVGIALVVVGLVVQARGARLSPPVPSAG